MKRNLTLLAAVAAIAAAVLGASSPAGAASGYTVANGTSAASCAKNATYSSIQSAVNAAPAGATVSVCPGTYQEYVTVPAGKDNLSIKGLGGDPTMSNSSSPVILYPTTPNPDPGAFDPNALVTVNGATGVGIQGVTVSGPFTDTGCEGSQTIHYGVFVIGGGSAQLEHDHITKIEPVDGSLFGCQDGVGIRAGSNFLGQVGTLSLKNSLVDQYEKGGVVVDGPGSSGDIQKNTITGVGPTAQTAQNGVQISRNAVGSVQGNTVANNEYTGTVAYSAAILFFGDASGSSAMSNKLTNNDIALDIESGGGDSVQGNQASTTSANAFAAGILAKDEAGTSFQGNKVSGGVEGIESFGVTSSTFKSNQVSGVSDVGLYNDSSSTGNTYKSNQASGSGTFDCQDASVGSGTAGTANTWQDDKGATSSPPGICKKG
jgi:hypothetical protein